MSATMSAAARMFNSSVGAMQGSRLACFIASPARGARTPPDYFPAGGGRAGRRATDYAVTGIRTGPPAVATWPS